MHRVGGKEKAKIVSWTYHNVVLEAPQREAQ